MIVNVVLFIKRVSLYAQVDSGYQTIPNATIVKGYSNFIQNFPVNRLLKACQFTVHLEINKQKKKNNNMRSTSRNPILILKKYLNLFAPCLVCIF